ncbi:hypothetical protein JR316_0006341 [Psilocybe cubensis]|uniref:Uncharacterized protein n=2 Tax=Psilocybe cubensis TaxID=181762 RepID=A0ACB8H290_PSICU|nr:hypothetical protein JR316_0006341 [Psilocybe cubensis]KAH9481814.1 hypothetical protein JR316_0006341 [Psilocybe cubensis]
MPESNGYLAPHPPSLFPSSEKQAFSGSTNSFSSSSSSASASYFDRHSHGSSTSAYATDITPPITPTYSNFDIELKPGTVASAGPFRDERSLQDHLTAEHLNNSILRPIVTLEDDTVYKSDSEDDSGVFDAVASFRTRLLNSKQTVTSQRALRIMDSRTSSAEGMATKDKDFVEAPPSVSSASKMEGGSEEEEFVLPHDWENIYDQGMAAIWKEFKESVYGFNPQDPEPQNLPLPYANRSEPNSRSNDFPIFDRDSDVGHQLGRDNIPRGMVFERLPPTPQAPAKPKIRPVESEWDVSSLCLGTPSYVSGSSFPMSLIPFVAAQHASDVTPSPTTNNDASCLSLCDGPSFESSASISTSLLSPAQQDTSPILSPAIFNESYAQGNVPVVSSPAPVSRLMFATRREHRSFPVALTGENLDMAAIIRLEIATNTDPRPQHLPQPNHGHYVAHGLPVTNAQQQQTIPPMDINSYPSFYDHSFNDSTMPESHSYQQFMIIASNCYDELTPEEENQYEYPNAIYQFLTRRPDFLQVKNVAKSPSPSTLSPLVGLGLGSLTDGAVRPSSSITRLEDEPKGVAGDSKKPAVGIRQAEHSSPHVDMSAGQCTAEIEPMGVLSCLQAMQSRMSVSLRGRREQQKVLEGPNGDHNVPHRQSSESGQSSSSSVDMAYIADDESVVMPVAATSELHLRSQNRTESCSSGPNLRASFMANPLEAGAGNVVSEPHGAPSGSTTSLERPSLDLVSSRRQLLLNSSKRLSRFFRSSPSGSSAFMSSAPVSSSAAASTLDPTDLASTIANTSAVTHPITSTIAALSLNHPSDSLSHGFETATEPFSGNVSRDTTSDLLGTLPKPSGHEPPLMDTVLSSPEHPSFLSRVSPLHQLARSLRSTHHLARPRANDGSPASSYSYNAQNSDVSNLGLTAFVLTPENDPRSPCSLSAEYFHSDSYVLGCESALPPTDHSARISSSASTDRVVAIPSSSSGGLAPSKSMDLEALGIGRPSGMLVTSVSTMSTAEECQNLAELASAPSPAADDLQNSGSDDTDLVIVSPQPSGSPTTPRLFFKVPRFAKRRLYDIPEQRTPSPTSSAHRIRTRTPTPHSKLLLARQPSESRKWSGGSVLRRLRSSSRVSPGPLFTNRKGSNEDGNGSNEDPTGDIVPDTRDNSGTSSQGDNVPALPAAKSTNRLRRYFNKITRKAVSVFPKRSRSSTAPPSQLLSPGFIENFDVPQPSFGVFRNTSDGRTGPSSRKLQVLF